MLQVGNCRRSRRKLSRRDQLPGISLACLTKVLKPNEIQTRLADMA